MVSACALCILHTFLLLRFSEGCIFVCKCLWESAGVLNDAAVAGVPPCWQTDFSCLVRRYQASTHGHVHVPVSFMATCEFMSMRFCKHVPPASQRALVACLVEMLVQMLMYLVHRKYKNYSPICAHCFTSIIFLHAWWLAYTLSLSMMRMIVCAYMSCIWQVSFLAFICGALMAWLFAFSGALFGAYSR